MNGSQFWELYQSYGDVYRQEVLSEEYEELDEGRTEEIRNRMQARYGKPESRDTLRQHVAREKYVTAAANHQSGWEKSPDTGKPGKLTKGQMMYKAHRSAEAMRGNVNASYEYDLYDIVLEHLLDEGFADTLEDAQVLMANMSEQWIDSIVEEAEEITELNRLEAHLRSKGQLSQAELMKKRRKGYERGDNYRRQLQAAGYQRPKKASYTLGSRENYHSDYHKLPQHSVTRLPSGKAVGRTGQYSRPEASNERPGWQKERLPAFRKGKEIRDRARQTRFGGSKGIPG